MGRLQTFCRNWAGCSLFNSSVGEGLLYIIFYGAIPIIIVIVSRLFLQDDELAVAYFYVSVLVNVLNCFYDVTCRWHQGLSSFIKVKLVVLSIPLAVVGVYTLFEIFAVLIGGASAFLYRNDVFLLFYFGVVFIALIDFFTCIGYEIIKCELA